MKQSIMKKVLSITVTLAMMFSMCVSALAIEANTVFYEVKGEDITLQALSSSSLLVTEGDKKSLLTFSENNNKIITTVQDVSSGEKQWFVRDNNTGTVYSSITGYTGVVQTSASEPGKYRISYKELLAYVGIAAGVTDIVAGVCAIAGVSAAAPVLGIVGGLMTIITGGLTLADENSGIEYTLDYVTISKWQGGRKYTVDVLKIVDIDTY